MAFNSRTTRLRNLETTRSLRSVRMFLAEMICILPKRFGAGSSGKRLSKLSSQSVLFYPTNNPRDPTPKETKEVKTRAGYGVSSEQLVVSEFDSSEDENYEMSENAEASEDDEDE